MESEMQPTDYLGLPPAFRDLLLRKEVRLVGQALCGFKPACPSRYSAPPPRCRAVEPFDIVIVVFMFVFHAADKKHLL